CQADQHLIHRACPSRSFVVGPTSTLTTGLTSVSCRFSVTPPVSRRGRRRMYREMIALGHRPPDDHRATRPHVCARGWLGGDPVVPVMALVSTITRTSGASRPSHRCGARPSDCYRLPLKIVLVPASTDLAGQGARYGGVIVALWRMVVGP